MREGSELPRLMVLLHAYNKENRADIHMCVKNAREGTISGAFKADALQFLRWDQDQKRGDATPSDGVCQVLVVGGGVY